MDITNFKYNFKRIYYSFFGNHEMSLVAMVSQFNLDDYNLFYRTIITLWNQCNLHFVILSTKYVDKVNCNMQLVFSDAFFTNC